MDRPVWWDKETTTMVAHHTKCTLAARSCYRYAIKQYYFYKIKNYILEDIYLHHRDDVLHPFLGTSQRFIGLVVPALVGLTGRGTGARTPLLGIGPTVHHPVTQSKPAIKVSIIN
jgi:hypothetical protein